MVAIKIRSCITNYTISFFYSKCSIICTSRIDRNDCKWRQYPIPARNTAGAKVKCNYGWHKFKQTQSPEIVSLFTFPCLQFVIVFVPKCEIIFIFETADCMYVFYECTLLFNLKGDISNDRDFRYIADCVASFQDCKFGPFYKGSDHQS